MRIVQTTKIPLNLSYCKVMVTYLILGKIFLEAFRVQFEFFLQFVIKDHHFERVGFYDYACKGVEFARLSDSIR